MEELKGQISAYYFKQCCEIHREGEGMQAKKNLVEASMKIWPTVPTNKRWPLKTSGCSKYQQNHTCMAQITAKTPCASTSPTTSITSTESSVETTTTEWSNKWVKNLSEIPLTEAQVSLLAHSPQFSYSSQKPPYGEYITAVEQACLNLEPHNAEELRAEIRGALKHTHNPRRNITKEEAQALAELRKDHSRVILTADKGVALVVINRTEYNSKSQQLLEDRET